MYLLSLRFLIRSLGRAVGTNFTVLDLASALSCRLLSVFMLLFFSLLVFMLLFFLLIVFLPTSRPTSGRRAGTQAHIYKRISSSYRNNMGFRTYKSNVIFYLRTNPVWSTPPSRVKRSNQRFIDIPTANTTNHKDKKS